MDEFMILNVFSRGSGKVGILMLLKCCTFATSLYSTDPSALRHQGDTAAKYYNSLMNLSHLPQVADANSPQPMDVAGESLLYDGFMVGIPL